MRTVVVLLTMSGLVAAQDPQDVFQRAVARQGGLLRANIKTVFLDFQGHARLEKTTQALSRQYWYTSKDRLFRQRTRAKGSDKKGSERGYDADGYWELDGKKRVRLYPTNREHRALVKTIRRDRADFERILQLVLLTRLSGARMRLVDLDTVKLRSDLPWSATSILGKDRDKADYYALEVMPKDAARLILYIRTSDHTVRKAIQFDKHDPQTPQYYYYFHYLKDGKLPNFFSAHDAEPRDKKTRLSTTLAYGEIKIRINDG